jgi:hypothetical protein
VSGNLAGLLAAVDVPKVDAAARGDDEAAVGPAQTSDRPIKFHEFGHISVVPDVDCGPESDRQMVAVTETDELRGELINHFWRVENFPNHNRFVTQLHSGLWMRKWGM